jgi:hypothetical protein
VCIPVLFALIIGIKYTKADGGKLTNLEGAVSDANDVEDFLKEHLHVLPENIVNLRDSSATRFNILPQFRELARGRRIQPGDPILIFYAGHGAFAPAPSGWLGHRTHPIIRSFFRRPQDLVLHRPIYAKGR